jgi:PRC-barrel domain
MEALMQKLDETAAVISASKVTGTNVYNTDGEHLGEIHDVMLDKRSGKIAYAVMAFGGFLGIGERYHPLPWPTLKYDTRQEGYVVGLTIDQLKGGPTYAADEVPAWGDRAYESRIHDYYKTAPYWGV